MNTINKNKYNASLLGIISEKELSRERQRGLILSLSLQRGVERLLEDKDYHRQVGKTARERSVLARINEHKESLMAKVDRIAENGIELISPFSLKYPNLVKFPKEDLPPAFLAMGNTKLLYKDRVAVVGKRDHNEWGRKFTVNITGELASRNIVVVSGMARGLDSISHRIALDMGGDTIAVLPMGHSIASAVLNRYQTDIDNGQMLVLSPFKPDAFFTKTGAYRRNGIICGLSRELYSGHVGHSGGTYHTVNLAQSRGLPVFIGQNPAMADKFCRECHVKGIRLLDVNGRPIRTPDNTSNK